MLTTIGWLIAKVGWSGIARAAGVKALGSLSGSWAWAVTATCVLVGALIAWHWWSPPERTYTAAEIRASRLAVENAELKRANAEKDRIVAERNKRLKAAADELEKQDSTMGELREKSQTRGNAVFAADDPWLQRHLKAGRR